MNVAHPKTAEQRIHKPIMADLAQTGMWLTNDNVSPRMTEMRLLPVANVGLPVTHSRTGQQSFMTGS